MTTAEAYPLQWPLGKARAIPQRSRFKMTGWDATQTLVQEVRRLGGNHLVISTNVELRQDGLPYANRKQPTDTAVAVYFEYQRKSMCFACDKWDSVGDNIHAIAKTIEALRGIERWGTGDMVQQAFTGFVALPAPGQAKMPWWVVLGVHQHATKDEVEQAFRDKAKLCHSDVGGSDAAMADLNSARDEYRKRI